MNLTISIQVSVDGVMQANGGNNDELDPGFTRGGWSIPTGDPESAAYIASTWQRADAFLRCSMGGASRSPSRSPIRYRSARSGVRDDPLRARLRQRP